jgi:hypothetical protein
MGAGEEDKEERERKAHKRVDDATPVSGPFLKAVVASQDLGAAGTEFERSLISFPCNKNYHFLYDFYGPLSLLFQCQFISLSCHLIPPIFSFFIRMPREAAWADFCFVRCFSRSAFLVACVTRSNEIYPIGDQPISPPRYSQIFLPTPAGSPGNVAPPSPPRYGPSTVLSLTLTKGSDRLTSSLRHFRLLWLVAHPVNTKFFRPCLPCLYRNPLVKPLAFLLPQQAP